MKAVAILCSLIFPFLIPATSSALMNVHLKSEFGQAGSGPGQFIAPQHIAIDKDGTLYVIDRGNRRIHVMAPDGRTIRTIGDKSKEGYLEEPSGIALYENYIYVSDAGKDMILLFTKDGRFINQFGRRGSGPKEFDEPAGLTLHLGTLYVADRGNNRVQIFSKDGIYLGFIGEKGEREGQLRDPFDVAVDYRGYLYVADYGNSRIQVFSPDGRFRRNYYDLKRPVSVDIDDAGFLVLDSEDYKIKKFDFSGRLLFIAGTRGDGPGQFLRPSGIALSPYGFIYVSDARKNTLQVFEPEESPVPSVEFMPPVESVNLIGEINVKASDVCWWRGSLYAVNPEDNAIYVIEGGTVKRVITGSDKYTLKRPSGIAIDRDGFIWVSDTGNDRIVKFSKDGKAVAEYGGSGSREGHFSSPAGIYISPQGLVYVADSGNRRIQILSTEGVFIGQIKKANFINLQRPVDVQADIQGNIYVVDAELHALFKINPQERLIFSIGKRGEGKGEFLRPSSVLLTPDEIYVLDAGNQRIQVFDYEERFLRMFGSKGTGKGEFLEPSGMSMTELTTLSVADRAGRIQTFRLLHTPEKVLNVKAEGMSKEIRLSWARAQEFYAMEYRIYRSEDKVNYNLIASTAEPVYTDRDVKHGITYYYRISAKAKEGYEGLKSDPVFAVALKPSIKPPAGVVTKPGIREIELSWKGEKGYIFGISKKKGDTFVEIGRTEKTEYIDRGLNPEMEYLYRIEAIGPEGERSEPIEIMAKTLSDKPALELTVLQMKDIITKAYRLYEKEGIGKVRLRNNLSLPLKDVRVQFIIRDFMEYPSETGLKEIAPGQVVDMELKPILDRRLLMLRDNRSLQSEITVLYSVEGERRSLRVPYKIMAIYTGKNYTEAEAKRLASSMRSLDDKVSGQGLEKELMKKLKERIDTDDSQFKRLRLKGLTYSEIIIVFYISKSEIDDLLRLRQGGGSWADIITLYDFSVSDVVTFIAEIDRVLAKPKPKTRTREIERGFYQ